MVDRTVLARKLAAIRDAAERIEAVLPATYGEAFTALAERGVIDRDLAARLRAAMGLRNLIAHQYGVLDFRRIFEVARLDVPDLVAFCRQLSTHIGDA